jgi:hypothetical protein
MIKLSSLSRGAMVTFVIIAACRPALAETVRLDDGTTCTVIEANAATGRGT